MSKETHRAPNVLRRAIDVMRGRKLRRFAGSDLSEIERKVTQYYGSRLSDDYYARLEEQDLWADTARRRDFASLCEAATDILDFGCGAGGLAVSLAERFPDKQIHAVDIGANAGTLIAGNKAGVDFRQSSVLSTPYADVSMDMLVSRFVIEHVVHPDRLLAEAFRILKPRGVLYLLYPQLLLKVSFGTGMREVISWIFNPDRLTYLDPDINETTSDTDDQDAVWLTNPFKIARLLRAAGFRIMANVPTESLVIAGKP
ncbi:MAG: class I SAM-dependent methyltransferase [Lentisphaerae bacterium]|nr:class I SAM-dependent methyltransferase [Lentisphaerota bacterium]